MREPILPLADSSGLKPLELPPAAVERFERAMSGPNTGIPPPDILFAGTVPTQTGTVPTPERTVPVAHETTPEGTVPTTQEGAPTGTVPTTTEPTPSSLTGAVPSQTGTVPTTSEGSVPAKTGTVPATSEGSVPAKTGTVPTPEKPVPSAFEGSVPASDSCHPSDIGSQVADSSPTGQPIPASQGTLPEDLGTLPTSQTTKHYIIDDLPLFNPQIQAPSTTHSKNIEGTVPTTPEGSVPTQTGTVPSAFEGSVPAFDSRQPSAIGSQVADSSPTGHHTPASQGTLPEDLGTLPTSPATKQYISDDFTLFNQQIPTRSTTLSKNVEGSVPVNVGGAVPVMPEGSVPIQTGTVPTTFPTTFEGSVPTTGGHQPLAIDRQVVDYTTIEQPTPASLGTVPENMGTVPSQHIPKQSIIDDIARFSQQSPEASTSPNLKPEGTVPTASEGSVPKDLGSVLNAESANVGKVDGTVPGKIEGSVPSKVPSKVEGKVGGSVPKESEGSVPDVVLQAAPVAAGAEVAAGPAQVAAAPIAVEIDPAAATARTSELVDAAVAVADTILVTPALTHGDGEVTIHLKPTVLDGSEIRLEAKGTTISVAIAPATVEAARAVERSIVQFEQTLAERMPSFQFAVSVAPAKGAGGDRRDRRP